MSMLFSDGVIRKKWKYLRDQFTVELGKITPSRSGDPAGATYEPKWPHFKSLLFLKDVVKPRQSTSNLTCARKVILQTCNDDTAHTEEGEEGLDNVGFIENNENEQESNEDMFESTIVADPAEHVDSGEMSSSTQTFGRKRKRNEGNAKYNETIIEIEKKKVQFLEAALTNRGEESEDMFFFRSLLPHVSNIPVNMKLRFRNRIQEVVEEFAYPSHQLRFVNNIPQPSPCTSTNNSRGTFYESSTPSPHTAEGFHSNLTMDDFSLQHPNMPVYRKL